MCARASSTDEELCGWYCWFQLLCDTKGDDGLEKLLSYGGALLGGGYALNEFEGALCEPPYGEGFWYKGAELFDGTTGSCCWFKGTFAPREGTS
ncbi:unnamed protein product [Candida parapsilosis]